MRILACDASYLTTVARSLSVQAKGGVSANDGSPYPLLKKQEPYIDSNGIVRSVIAGPMFADDDFWETGLRSNLEMMLALDSLPEARGHFIEMDTGGGTLSAGQLAYDTISSLTKPSIAHCTYACSAGIMAIAPCTEIWVAGGGASIVGSVGVLESWPTWFLQYYTTLFTDIYADTSERKREQFKGLVQNDQSLTKEVLNKIDSQFMALVKRHRPNATEDALSGAIFVGREAIRNGLADGQANIRQAINRLNTLIRQA